MDQQYSWVDQYQSSNSPSHSVEDPSSDISVFLELERKYSRYRLYPDSKCKRELRKKSHTEIQAVYFWDCLRPINSWPVVRVWYDWMDYVDDHLDSFPPEQQDKIRSLINVDAKPEKIQEWEDAKRANARIDRAYPYGGEDTLRVSFQLPSSYSGIPNSTVLRVCDLSSFNLEHQKQINNHLELFRKFQPVEPTD